MRVGLLFWLLGCGASDESGGACDRDPPLTYTNFGQGFIGRHCAGCHSSLLPEDHRNGAPLGIDLDTLEGVQKWAERVRVRTVPADGGMPPGGGPTEEERAMVAEWLECSLLAEESP